MNVLGIIIFWLVIAELFVVLNLYLWRTYVSWRGERTAAASRKEQQQKEETDTHSL